MLASGEVVTANAVGHSLPARNEWGESRREGWSQKNSSSPQPSPPSFVRRGGGSKAAGRPHTRWEKGGGGGGEGGLVPKKFLLSPALSSFLRQEEREVKRVRSTDH